MQPDLWKFKVWYRQQQAPRKLADEARHLGDGVLTPEVQAAVVSQVICGDSGGNFLPVGSSYRRRTLTELIRAAEADGCQLAEGLTDAFIESQLGQGGHDDDLPSGWCQKTFTYGAEQQSGTGVAAQQSVQPESKADSLRLPGVITVHASQNLLEGGTGCAIWSAGLVLSEFCLSNASMFAGKRCIELGSGTGTLGVTLARAGASTVLLTDGNENALQNCQQNLERNGVTVSAEAKPTDCTTSQQVRCIQRAWDDDWGDISTPVPDYIVGSDLMYDPDLVPLLVERTKQLLTASPQEAGQCRRPQGLFAGQERSGQSLRVFEQAVQASGLKFQEVPRSCTVTFQHLLCAEALDLVKLYKIEAC